MMKLAKIVLLFQVVISPLFQSFASDSAQESPEFLKEEGNSLFKAKDYKGAYAKYQAAYQVKKDPVYLSNAAFSALKLGNHGACQKLCKRVLKSREASDQIKFKNRYRLFQSYSEEETHTDEAYELAKGLKEELSHLEKQTRSTRAMRKNLDTFIQEKTRTIYLGTDIHANIFLMSQQVRSLSRKANEGESLILTEAKMLETLQTLFPHTVSWGWGDDEISTFAGIISFIYKRTHGPYGKGILSDEKMIFDLYNFFLRVKLSCDPKALALAATEHKDKEIFQILLKEFTPEESESSRREMLAILKKPDYRRGIFSSWGLFEWTQKFLARERNYIHLEKTLLRLLEFYNAYTTRGTSSNESLRRDIVCFMQKILEDSNSFDSREHKALIAELYQKVTLDLRDDFMASLAKKKLDEGYQKIVIFMGFLHYKGAIARLAKLPRVQLVRVKNEEADLTYMVSFSLQRGNIYEGQDHLKKISFKELLKEF